jgi:hypothetical protein
MTSKKLALLVLISFMLAACASTNYKGEYLDGKYHGQGAINYANGDKYVGGFKKGKFYGQGGFRFASGDKYTGEFRSGMYQGQGTFFWKNGRKYVGEWKADKQYGQGTFTRLDSSTYIGEWENGAYHGQGIYTAADGKITVGIWANGKLKQETLNPKSTMLVNGGSYVGGVANGRPSGKGIYTRQLGKWTAIKVYSDNWTEDGAATGVRIEIPRSRGIYYFNAPILKNFIASGTIKVSEGTRNSSDKPYSEVPYEGIDTFPNASFSQDIRYIGSHNASYKRSFRIKEKQGYTGVLDQWGKKQGPGKLVTGEKRVYLGSFKDDLFHGDNTSQYYDGVVFENANYFNGFKIGYGKIYYSDGTQFKTIYDKGRAVDGTIISKDIYTKKDNTSTFDHAEGKVQYLKNNQVVTEYDLSDPSKFTFCNVSNIDWPERIMVLGKSCAKATVGFTPILSRIFKNLKLVGSSGDYLIHNADLEEVVNVGGSTVGTFRKGSADLTLFDYKTGRVSYRGGFSNHERHGNAFCAYANGLEPCRYQVGKRIDETHLARVAQKKREDEAGRLAKQVQYCQNNFNYLETEMNRMGNLGSASCQVHINDALDGLDTVVRRADCGACGQRDFKQANGSAYSCVKENRRQLNRVSSSANDAISGLGNNNCLDQAAQSQMHRGVDNLQREVSSQLNSIEASSDNLDREYQRIIWPKLDRIAINNNAVWTGAIDAFKSAARDVMAQKRQNHNVQLGLVRQQQQLQQTLKIQRSNVQANQNFAVQKQNTTSTARTKAFVDPRAAAKKSCRGAGRTWNGKYCNVISTITFPGRACYDPSGKSCKTGETVYYDKNTGNYDAAFQRSDATVQAKFNTGSNQGGSNTGADISGTSTSTGSSSQAQDSGSQTKQPELGPVKVEVTSYCWQEKGKSSWICHGTTQRTTGGEKLESAKSASGCSLGTRKKPLNGGLLFYCGYGMETYHDDIASIYSAPGALLGARNNYQCKRYSLKTCRDIMAQ